MGFMATEMLSYSELGDRLSCSPEAARSLVKRLRLPRQKANNGKVLVSVDLSEINHKPMPARSPADDPPIKRLRLPRQKANNGKVLVSVDLSEINHKPMPARSPADDH